MRKYHQGSFIPKNPKKYIGDSTNIVFRSSWELKFMKWCDSDDYILEWASEEICIPYYDNTTKAIRKYYPDFYMIKKNHINEVIKYIIEIKPKKQTMPPKTPKRKTKNWLYESVTYAKNQCKWNAAELFCKKNGLEFLIITENELYNYSK